MKALRFARAHRGHIILLLFAGFLYFYLRLFQDALIDDAFITLTYVRNLAQNGAWGFFPGHVTNTATSPLNVILLAAISKLVGTIASPIWLALICFTVMGIALDRISLQLLGSRWFGRLATLALVFNPLLISTLGLESILFCTLLVLVLWCVLGQRWRWLGLALGMLSITRADGFLMALVVLLLLPTSRARLESMLVLGLSAAPWYAFSWIHLGSLLPDTLMIRLSDASWNGPTFINGPGIYLRRYPVQTLLSFAYLPLVAAIFSRQVRDTPLAKPVLILAAAHFVAYSLLRVPPYHWYYASEATLVIVFGMLSLGVMYRTWDSGMRLKHAARGLLLLAVLVPTIGMLQFVAGTRFQVTEMPIHSNQASQAQYKEAGLWLKEHIGQDTVLQKGEIGTLAYYCECQLLDPFSDRTWIRDGAHRAVAGGGLGAALYGANFLFLRADGGYAPPSYTLAVRGIRTEPTAADVMRWLTSSKWVGLSEIVLSRY